MEDSIAVPHAPHYVTVFMTCYAHRPGLLAGASFVPQESDQQPLD
jgi:hypothetical protein